MKVKVMNPSGIPKSWYNSVIGLDIETEDKFLDSPICMVSLHKPSDDLVIVIPVKVYKDNSLAVISDAELETFKNFLKTIRVVGHNLQFDLALILHQWGVEVSPYFDTFIFARMMQFEQQGLKDIYLRLNPKMGNVIRKFENVLGTKPPFTYNIDDENVVKYSAYDAVMPFTIIKAYSKSIQKLMDTIRIEMNYLRVAIRMKSTGLRFDLTKFGELYKKYEDRVKQMQAELDAYAGEHVRITSNADLMKLLVDTMGCTSSVLTGKGMISMNEESRAQMYDNCTDESKRKIIKLVGDLKHEHSITNSTKKIPDFVVDGNLTFNVEQIGYDGTARVYTKDTSVNQIPKEIREAIIPSEGKKFMMFDWKSAELFISAYWSKCKSIIEWYEKGVDLHSEIAKRLLGLTNITKEQRALSKVVSFATIYGSEGAAVSRRLNISDDEGRDLVQRYMAEFPEIAKLRADIVNKAHKNYATFTMMGRRRRLPEINSDQNAVREQSERRAFNTAIQASCADFFKMAACKADAFADMGVVYKFGVFDSHLLEVPLDFTEDDCRKVAEFMSDFSDLFPDFKFRFDLATGSNWLECQNAL